MTEQTLPQRKYALTKIATGDYLLPSNDAKTIWRIHRYSDGPSAGLEDWAHDRDVWGLWRWAEQFDIGKFIDVADWTRWAYWGGPFETRAEGIDAALRWRLSSPTSPIERKPR